MILTVRGDRIEASLGGVCFCGVSQDVRHCLKNRLIRLCHVPGVGFANAVVAKIGSERELIFCMIAGGSGAERCRVLSSLRRTIVGGGRQRRGRLVKLCGVPGGRFAVVAKMGIERELIFSRVADGRAAGRPRVLISLG